MTLVHQKIIKRSYLFIYACYCFINYKYLMFHAITGKSNIIFLTIRILSYSYISNQNKMHKQKTLN